ncbi:MAG: hypothetical protein V4603_15110 [Pseudomonadota bacterium]
MADTLTTLQQLYILTHGKMANTTVLASQEASFNANGGYGAIDGTITSILNDYEAANGTAATAQLIARQGLGLEITATQAINAVNGLKAAGLNTWAKMLHHLADEQGALTTTLDNRAEAAMHFRAQLAAKGNTGFFSGTSIDAAASNVIQSIGSSAQSLETGKQSMTDLAGRLSSSGIRGQIADGYYASSIVHADANENFWESPGEWGALANDYGTVIIPANADTGRYILTGGVDFLTKLPFRGVMAAPASSPVVTPLTTLVQNLLDKGQSILQATTTVKAALGLAANVDVLTYEPRKVLMSSTASAEAKAAAFTAEKAILQVSNTATQIGVAIDAAANNDSSSNRAFEVYEAMATVVNERGSAGLKIDLTDAAVIARIIATGDLNGLVTASASRLTLIVDASNTAIATASGGAALAKAATVTQGAVVEALIGAMDNNTLDAMVTAYTGASLDAKIAVAVPGQIIPPEVTVVGSAIESGSVG